jgi:hypothetical protein
MTGSMRLPSIAVVAIVEPEIAENTVPRPPQPRQAAPALADQVLDSVDHFHREPRVEQHFAHEDEQGNGGEREARDRPDAVARELDQARLAAEEQPRAQQVDHQERERDRQPEEQQQRRAAEHEPCRRAP